MAAQSTASVNATSTPHQIPPKSTRTSFVDFLPPQSAKKYIKPMSGIALQAVPPPPALSSASSSSSSASSSSSFSAVSSSSYATPPSDHGSLDDKEALEISRATREYHASVRRWTAKTWQAVRFVIEQRSRHPAYNNTAPRPRSRSPHYPIQNQTSLHALTAQPGSASSSSCTSTSTPSSLASPLANPQRQSARDLLPPSRLSSQLSFTKKSVAVEPPKRVSLLARRSMSSATDSHLSNKDAPISGLSALFGSHSISDDATSSSSLNFGGHLKVDDATGTDNSGH